MKFQFDEKADEENCRVCIDVQNILNNPQQQQQQQSEQKQQQQQQNKNQNQ